MRDHLIKRKLDINVHNPIIDDINTCCTFYLYSLTGVICGYQLYRPYADKKKSNDYSIGKYYTYKKQPIIAPWGVESLLIDKGPIFITEGIFDACRLTWKGKSALAFLSNNPSKDSRTWLDLFNRPIIAVCDNDKAGKILGKFGHYIECPPDGKDLGDSDESYIDYLINKWA